MFKLRDKFCFVRKRSLEARIALDPRPLGISAAVELRHLFPGITDTALARECVRTIAGWRPLPKRLRPVRLRTDKTS